jgi:integral membrane protein (TIGR01906 family)
VPASLGTDQAGVDHLTGIMLRDLFTGGDFLANIDDDPPILDASERSHMQDVGGLVRGLAVLELVAVGTLLVSWRGLRRERARRGRLLLRAAGGVGAGALILAAFFAISFDTAFAAFHALFFKSGTWQFGPDSNLIRLFPEPFWFEVSLLAGATIVVCALLAAWLARRDLAAPPVGG